MDGGRFALLIGTWHYQNDQLPNLASPERDVRDFGAALADRQIGAFDEVNVLENKTAQEIRIAIEDFFSDRLHADLLVLYFSGHGLKNEHGHFYFAACDTDPKRLIATGISATLIHEVIHACRSRKKVILLDSCFGGAVVRGFLVKSAAQITPDELGGDATGLIILTATDSLSYALESTGGHKGSPPSVFTKHLVHGLATGEADLEHDGVVTIDELYDYTCQQVKREVPGQNPKKWAFEAAGNLILAHNPNPSLIMFPKEIEDLLANRWFPAVRLAAIEPLMDIARKPHMRGRVIAAFEKLLEDDSSQIRSRANEALLQLRSVASDKQPTRVDKKDPNCLPTHTAPNVPTAKMSEPSIALGSNKYSQTPPSGKADFRGNSTKAMLSEQHATEIATPTSATTVDMSSLHRPSKFPEQRLVGNQRLVDNQPSGNISSFEPLASPVGKAFLAICLFIVAVILVLLSTSPYQSRQNVDTPPQNFSAGSNASTSAGSNASTSAGSNASTSVGHDTSTMPATSTDGTETFDQRAKLCEYYSTANDTEAAARWCHK